jgi:hypothetical protein
MSDPTESAVRPFRLVLDGGEVVESGGVLTPRYADAPVPELVLRLPMSRAHWLAHVLAERPRPAAMFSPADRELARMLEAAAATLGDTGAMSCTTRDLGGATGAQRLAATAVLGDREPRLSGVQRMAIVDAAARWLNESAGDELALALLTAVCESSIAANQVYMALIAPPIEEP